MSWISIELSVPAERHDAVCAVLEDAGAPSISSLDAGDWPVLEPAPGGTPLWSWLQVSALFDGDYAAADAAHCKACLDGACLGSMASAS